jgi:hypothetical protein
MRAADDLGVLVMGSSYGADGRERMLVFDAAAWGGRDVGDNSQFWREAELLERQGFGNRETATVRFLHDGRVSRGHFVFGMKPVPVQGCSAPAFPVPEEENER